MKKMIFLALVLTMANMVLMAQTTALEWFNKGVALQDNGETNEAIVAYKKAVALQPTYGVAWHKMAWCYNELSQYTEAVDVLKKEEPNTEDMAGFNFEMGYALKGLQKFDEALTCFDKAIADDPEYSLAYRERGKTYHAKGEYEKELSDYQKYAELEEEIKSAYYYYDRGWVENELEMYSDAIQSLDKSIAINATDVAAWDEIAYAHYKLKNNTESLMCYREAARLDKTSHKPLMGMGDVFYNNVKNYDSAIVYYEKGLKLNPQDGTALYRVGWCYNDKGKYREASVSLVKAIAIDKEDYTVKAELGYSYYKLGECNNALNQLKPVITNRPKDELVRYYAGMCYSQQGNQTELRKMHDELKVLNSKYATTLAALLK